MLFRSVTWMDRQQARLEFRRSADGAGVRWLDVTTGRILMERTFTVIGQEAYLWSRDEGHTIAATYVDGTGRLGDDHLFEVAVFE